MQIYDYIVIGGGFRAALLQQNRQGCMAQKFC